MFICVKYNNILRSMKFFAFVGVILAVTYCLPVSSGQDAECQGDNEKSWSYKPKNGPITWGDRYPTCGGSKQSPVDISNVEDDPNLKSMEMTNYNLDVQKAKILNDGHTVVVTPMDSIDRLIRINGSTFYLTQLHFHWGSQYQFGSEHTFSSKAYALEVHFVHISDVGGNVAVVGVLYQETPRNNPYLSPIIEKLSKVRFEKDQTNLTSPINLSKLLPETPLPIYRYFGSLTTPGCAEGVAWSVSKKIGIIGTTQLKIFRSLYSVTKDKAERSCHLQDNFRPVQPLNGRKVFSST